MFAMLLGVTLYAGVGELAAPVPVGTCESSVVTPTRLELQQHEADAPDGTRTWTSEAKYRLSTGETGQAWVVLDSDGTGEVQLLIAGEIIAHVAVASDPVSGELTTTSWYPPAVDHAPDVLTEMMIIDLPTALAGQIPQEFQCSPFGAKATRAAAMLFRAASYATVGICCAGASATIVGCGACAAAVGLAGHEIGKALDEHCD
jgi:hypothetical protein